MSSSLIVLIVVGAVCDTQRNFCLYLIFLFQSIDFAHVFEGVWQGQRYNLLMSKCHIHLHIFSYCCRCRKWFCMCIIWGDFLNPRNNLSQFSMFALIYFKRRTHLRAGKCSHKKSFSINDVYYGFYKSCVITRELDLHWRMFQQKY